MDFYRKWKVKLIADILNISFNFEWTEFLVIKLVIRPCYLNISS
jgi:hypothetical protein